MGRISDARERLIQACIDLIWTESYGSVGVDALCERADVRKGSFYHFFRSKEDLVVAALESEWQSRRATLDSLFSPTVEPLERLRDYFRSVVDRHLGLRKRYGRLVGCFYVKVGMEVPQDGEIAHKVQSILGNYVKYYESALRDAVAAGVAVEDVPQKARALFAFMEGVVNQARVLDDPTQLENLEQQAFRFLRLEPNLTNRSSKKAKG